MTETPRRLTPSQTVGPYLSIGLARRDHVAARRPERPASDAAPRHAPRRRRRAGPGRHDRDLAGERRRPLRPPGSTTATELALEDGFLGFGRSGTVDGRPLRVRRRSSPAACRGPRAVCRRPTWRSASSRAGCSSTPSPASTSRTRRRRTPPIPCCSRLDEEPVPTLVAGRRGRRPALRHPAARAGPDGILRGVSPFAPSSSRASCARRSRGAPGSPRCSMPRPPSRAPARCRRRPSRGCDRDRRGLRRRRLRLGSAARRGPAGRHPGRAARARPGRASSGRRRPGGSTWVRRARTSWIRPRCSSPAGRSGSCSPSSIASPPRARSLARSHRDTPMAGRTLLQQAVPTTFGLKAAGWLVAVLDARTQARRAAARGASPRSSAARPARWPRSASAGLEIARLFAERARSRRSRRCPGTRTAFGSPSSAQRSRSPRERWRRSALDVLLLAQTEVAEVARAEERRSVDGDAPEAQPGRRDEGPRVGRARSRPRVRAHRRARAGARARGGCLAGGVGGAVRRAPVFAGGAAAALAGALEGLEVDAGTHAREPRPHRRTIAAERVALLLTERLGRTAARTLVRDGVAACGRGHRRPLGRRARSRDTGLTRRGDRRRARADDVSRLGRGCSSTGRSRATTREGRRRMTAPPRRRRSRPARRRSCSRAPSARRSRCGSRSWRALAERFRGRALRPAWARPLARCRRGRTTIDDLGARPRSSCSTRSELERVSFCGLSIGGIDGHVARRRTRRHGSTGSRSAARRPRSCPGQGWIDRAAAVRAGGVAAIADAVLARWFRPAFHDDAPGRRRALPRDARRDPRRGVRGLLRGARRRSTSRARLAAITAPTLVHHGRRRPRRDPRRRRRARRGDPGARHAVDRRRRRTSRTSSNPDAFTAALLRHLGRRPEERMSDETRARSTRAA